MKRREFLRGAIGVAAVAAVAPLVKFLPVPRTSRLSIVEGDRITTVAKATAIVLPPSVPGLEIFVANHGEHHMKVFGRGADTIDEKFTVTQLTGSCAIYLCAKRGKWYTEGLSRRT